MATSRKPVERDYEAWELINWSKYGPHGAATLLKVAAPCKVCRKPAWLLSPEKQVPMHKTCAEEFYLVQILAPILVALGTTQPRFTDMDWIRRIPHDALP